MHCWGFTKQHTLCKNNCRFFVCKKHLYQPFILIFTLGNIYLWAIGIYGSFWSKPNASQEDTQSIENLINKRFDEFKVPNPELDTQFPGFSVDMVIRLKLQKENRRKYIFDLAKNPDHDRVSLYLDADNIMTFQVLDKNGETYNVKIPPATYSFNKFMFLQCDYGFTDEFSFLRLFINNKFIEQYKFKFKITLPDDYKEHMILMADIFGKNGTAMTISHFSLSKFVFGKTLRRGIYNTTRWYFKQINKKIYDDISN